MIILEIGARGYSLLVKKNLCAKNLNIKKYESEYHSDIGYEPMPGKKMVVMEKNIQSMKKGIGIIQILMKINLIL